MVKFLQYIGLTVGFFFSQLNPIMAAYPLRIVAAENFYGGVAKEIGGHYVQVVNVLNQPDQDPHLFTVSFSVAKDLAEADIVVYNGLGYDAWISPLLQAHCGSKRRLICVSDWVKRKEGDNPHIWYDPNTMPIYAEVLLTILIKKDPKHRCFYELNYKKFAQHSHELMQHIERLKSQFKNISVIATEPVFGYMAEALKMRMKGIPFQNSMMNGVDPSPRQVQAFRDELRQARILFYNKQVSSPFILDLLRQAKHYAIPTLGITETQPINKTYNEWMQDQLTHLEHLLDGYSKV